MRKRKFVVEAIIGVAAVAFLPFWYQMSAGLVLGYAFSMLYLRFLGLRVDSILAAERVGVLTYFGSLLGIALLACPIALAVFHPEHVSWVGVLIGLLARKAALYFEAFRGGAHDA